MLILPECAKPSEKQSGVSMEHISFRDIPGVTEDEINAVEALRKQYSSFVYGSMPSTEAFLDEHGNIRGYSALFCEWLTELFGIPFIPEHLPIDVFLEKMASFEVAFTGDMTPSEERRKVFFMTDAIAEHAVRSFRIAGSEELEIIAQSRPLRYGFVPESTNINDVISHQEPGSFEIVLINNTDAIYYALKNGEIDAFFSEELFEAVFDSYGNVVAKDFYPLTYVPVSLTTQNPAFVPIINIVQKALENGALRYLTELYNRGYKEYQRHKLFLLLNEEELAYVHNNPIVPILANYSNYPVSFYNEHENKWQGCAFDVLNEIEMFTGLSFKVANNQQTEFPELLQKLQNHEAPMITELPNSKGLDGLFLWTGNTILSDNFALLSKSELQRLNVNEILQIKVGLIEDTAAALLFNNWFPAHPELTYYKSIDDAIKALENYEVDAVMATLNNLLMLTNLMELSDYKANIVFDTAYSSTFGFNKDEPVLCSIVDKALALVNTKAVSEDWTRRIFDYQAKLVQTQRSWLIVASIISIFVFILILVLLQKSLRAGKRLKSILVQYEVLWESVQSGAAVIDAETREIISVNSSAVRMFGGPKEDLIGKQCDVLFEVIDGCPIMDHKQIIENEERAFKKASGECVPAIKSVVEIEYNGRAALLESFTDISHIKKAQEAKDASEAKSQFLANMSHEMRTPMNVVVGLTDLMLDEDDPTVHFKDNLRKISVAGNTLLGLINDVLDISKIEAGKLEL
ncbi:MAG: transporter substrate-binding domain-containing protein, partial [Treponema sp.]|nr:transporter substrate-binding domain-containing protein [Treponema sp.]